MFHELKNILVENFFYVIIIASSIEKSLVAMKKHPMAFGLGYLENVFLKPILNRLTSPSLATELYVLTFEPDFSVWVWNNHDIVRVLFFLFENYYLKNLLLKNRIRK